MKSKGLTLIELLVSFSITMILISLIMSFMFIASKRYRKIIIKQRWMSQTLLFRNILENNLLSLSGNLMSAYPIPFEGNAMGVSFDSLQESSKGFFKRKISLHFLELSHTARLIFTDTDSSENILFKKEMKNIEKFFLSYFDPLQRVWVQDWSGQSFFPEALRLKIKHKLFKDPITFIIDICYGKIF